MKRMKPITLTAVATLLILAACSNTGSEPNPYQVTGTVKYNAEPYTEGATVYVSSKQFPYGVYDTATSDASGAYTLDYSQAVDEGEFSLVTSIDENFGVSVTIEIQDPPGLITKDVDAWRYLVISPDHQAPVPGNQTFTITNPLPEAISYSWEVRNSFFTLQDAQISAATTFTLNDLPPAEYRLSIDATGTGGTIGTNSFYITVE